MATVTTLDPKCEDWVRRLVAAAPPLSQRQQDIIAAAFSGAFAVPGPNHDAKGKR